MFFRRIIRKRRFRFTFGFLQRIQLALRPRNIGRLSTNVADKPDFLQAVLLFLLVENQADAVVGVFRIAAEVCNILLLAVLITDGDGAVGNRRLGGAFGMPAVACGRDNPARHVPFKLVPHVAGTADADARVFGFEVRFVMQVAEAEGSGVEIVLICCGSGSNDGTIQLGMVTDIDVKAAIARIQSGLFGH